METVTVTPCALSTEIVALTITVSKVITMILYNVHAYRSDSNNYMYNHVISVHTNSSSDATTCREDGITECCIPSEDNDNCLVHNYVDGSTCSCAANCSETVVGCCPDALEIIATCPCKLFRYFSYTIMTCVWRLQVVNEHYLRALKCQTLGGAANTNVYTIHS